LPSNLRPTTRDCANLVTRGHFQSRDKDVGHINRSAIAKNLKLHAKLTGLCVTDCLSNVSNCGNGDFRRFCSCDLDLDPMIFIYIIYKLDPHSMEMYRMSEEITYMYHAALRVVKIKPEVSNL